MMRNQSLYVSIRSLWIVTLLVLAENGLGMPQYSCNICRDPPSGVRYLINGEKTFRQSNGVTASCNELQKWVQDVDPTPTGAPGEARLCATTQYIAELNCECAGPAIPSIDDLYRDPNAACRLCGGTGLDFDYVPPPNADKLTDTKVVGRQNCGGLQLAAAEGIFSSSMCSQIQTNSGRDCCNLDIIDIDVIDRRITTNLPTSVPAPAPTQNPTASPPTISPAQTCLNHLDECEEGSCCIGLVCRPRSIGAAPVCSKAPRNDKTRISDGKSAGGLRTRGLP
jgi:hypothetical protein